MSPVEYQLSKKGHPRGGLSCTGGAALLAALALAGCGPPPPPANFDPAGPEDSAPLPDPLGVYRQLGFVVGGYDFPAVGRFVFLPGPADSTHAIFTFSIPNSALRFRREEPGYLARYEVRVVVGDSAAPVARLNRTEEVRVRTFRETARRDESVLFQGLLTVPPGEYPATMQTLDLASRRGFGWVTTLRAPAFGPGSVTAPIAVYRVEPRSSREEPPALIINPRATVRFGGPAPLLYLESLAGDTLAAMLELAEGAAVTRTDTFHVEDPPPPLSGVSSSLDPADLTPGALTLRARSAATAAADSARLLVALEPDWVTADYGTALSYLRYAGTPQQLDSLQSAAPGERAGMLLALWSRRDPDPSTPENEFFDLYFRRIRDANDRFSSLAGPGWLTDRGAVYVTLGPPDEVTRHLDARQEAGESQVWIFDESIGYELRLVFVDIMGMGDYRLTDDSRRAFQAAVRRLYS